MKNYNKELIVKILILLVLVLLIFTTSFRSGEKYYILKNTYFGESQSKVKNKLARWKFEAKIHYPSDM